LKTKNIEHTRDLVSKQQEQKAKKPKKTTKKTHKHTNKNTYSTRKVLVNLLSLEELKSTNQKGNETKEN
jgi:hypothetical protein